VSGRAAFALPSQNAVSLQSNGSPSVTADTTNGTNERHLITMNGDGQAAQEAAGHV